MVKGATDSLSVVWSSWNRFSARRAERFACSISISLSTSACSTAAFWYSSLDLILSLPTAWLTDLKDFIIYD